MSKRHSPFIRVRGTQSWLFGSFAFVVVTLLTLSASPFADLSSSSQDTRDHAAAILRASYTPPSRSRWEPLLAQIVPGDTIDSVRDRLRTFNVTSVGGMGSGDSFNESYRLDDRWLLDCTYRRQRDHSAARIITSGLSDRLRNVWVAPASDFSGVWTTYFVSGQRSHEIHYQNGKYSGKFTAFHSNGRVSYIQYYGPNGADGPDTGYYPSGQLMYEGSYRSDRQVGTWTHYNEDGSVRTTAQHPGR